MLWQLWCLARSSFMSADLYSDLNIGLGIKNYPKMNLHMPQSVHWFQSYRKVFFHVSWFVQWPPLTEPQTDPTDQTKQTDMFPVSSKETFRKVLWVEGGWHRWLYKYCNYSYTNHTSLNNTTCPICLCLNIVEYFNVTVVLFKMKLPPKEGRSRELSETVELFQF